MNHTTKYLIFKYLNYESLIKMISIDENYICFLDKKELSNRYFDPKLNRLGFYPVNEKGQQISDRKLFFYFKNNSRVIGYKSVISIGVVNTNINR